MLNDVLNFATMSLFAQIALVMFAVAFLGICFVTMTRSREELDANAQIPLHDDSRSATNE